MSDDPSRRKFLKSLTAGAAAWPLQAGGREEQSHAMPGRPSANAHPETASTVMAIAAHPGDAFFAMGAAVAQQIQNGGHGVFLSLSLGENGSATIASHQYGPMQQESSLRAARALGAQFASLPYPDGQTPYNDAICLAVCDLLRQYKPAVVITHWRGSWHKDHRNCYRIVNDALFYAALPAMVRKLPAHTVGRLYFAENWEDAEGFRADTYLDVSGACAQWLKACSLFPMWRGETGFRYDKYYGSLAVSSGCLSGFRRAVALMSPAEQLTRRVRRL